MATSMHESTPPLTPTLKRKHPRPLLPDMQTILVERVVRHPRSPPATPKQQVAGPVPAAQHVPSTKQLIFWSLGMGHEMHELDIRGPYINAGRLRDIVRMTLARHCLPVEGGLVLSDMANTARTYRDEEMLAENSIVRVTLPSATVLPL
jgi:hypothetical protein